MNIFANFFGETKSINNRISPIIVLILAYNSLPGRGEWDLLLIEHSIVVVTEAVILCGPRDALETILVTFMVLRRHFELFREGAIIDFCGHVTFPTPTKLDRVLLQSHQW